MYARCILAGDLNARMPLLQNMFGDIGRQIAYEKNVDAKSNSHTKEVSLMCKECNIVPLNHMIYGDKKFEGNLTFRKGKQWVTQVD